MALKKDVKNFTIPKFIVQKFKLVEYSGRTPDYVKKSGIILTNTLGNTLYVENLSQLRDVLFYLRAAGQICLHLIYKHMIIERNDNEEKDKVLKIDEEVAVPSLTSLGRPKSRPKRILESIKLHNLIGSDMFRTLPKDIKSDGDANDQNVNLTLRFGVSSSLLYRPAEKYLSEIKMSEEELEKISKNDFYKHLILKSRKPSFFKRSFDEFVYLFGSPYKFH